MRKKRETVSSFALNEHDVLGGKAKILTTKASGGVWQVRIWISEEKKYLRKSLKTRDFETAIERAEEFYLQTYSDVKSGKKLFGISVEELVDLYKKWRSEDVKVGNITSGRLVTISSQLKHFSKYKGLGTKISELDRMSCYDYTTWRKAGHSDVRDTTIINEQSTVNHMMTFAFRNGYAHFDGFEFRKIKINKDAVIRRDTFSLDEYDGLVRFLRSYVSKKQCPDENIRAERLLVRDCILIASNTMMRVGELWQLRWRDVESVRKVPNDEGGETALVTISVRAETSKVRRSRRVIARGGEYFNRLRERSVHTDPDDYVFHGISGNTTSAKERRYHHWKVIMDGCKFDYKARNLTWYSLRHFGITCRIRAGVKYGDIAKAAGTSITYIEQHYGHVDDHMLTSAALKNFKVSSDGLIYSSGDR